MNVGRRSRLPAVVRAAAVCRVAKEREGASYAVVGPEKLTGWYVRLVPRYVSNVLVVGELAGDVPATLVNRCGVTRESMECQEGDGAEVMMVAGTMAAGRVAVMWLHTELTRGASRIDVPPIHGQSWHQWKMRRAGWDVVNRGRLRWTEA